MDPDLCWDDIKWIRNICPDLPLVIKGIQCVEVSRISFFASTPLFDTESRSFFALPQDALMCVEHKVDGIGSFSSSSVPSSKQKTDSFPFPVASVLSNHGGSFFSAILISRTSIADVNRFFRSSTGVLSTTYRCSAGNSTTSSRDLDFDGGLHRQFFSPSSSRNNTS